jgi:hypothetical protein
VHLLRCVRADDAAFGAKRQIFPASDRVRHR